ncbi:hypothetical protein K1719_021973 [Acacia pycnantha]|nr:hypothetical protein K1719_021973 [Acacia pycnantha]
MAPSLVPESHDSNVSTKSLIPQIWHKSGSCPKGTVPICRIQKNDLLRAQSLKRFSTKPPLNFNTSLFVKQINATNKLTLPDLDNRSAALLATMGYNYIGARADFKICNPPVDLPDDYTTAQMWLKSGNGPTFESVESGWMVNPKLYGDRRTRLFAYWTKDSYKTTVWTSIYGQFRHFLG